MLKILVKIKPYMMFSIIYCLHACVREYATLHSGVCFSIINANLCLNLAIYVFGKLNFNVMECLLSNRLCLDRGMGYSIVGMSDCYLPTCYAHKIRILLHKVNSMSIPLPYLFKFFGWDTKMFKRTTNSFTFYMRIRLIHSWFITIPFFV